MDDDVASRFDLECRRFVELVTDYLDGSLDRETTDAVDLHLRRCRACREYLLQIRATVAATGRLTRTSLDLRTLTALLAAFRELLGATRRRPGAPPSAPRQEHLP